MLAPIYAHLPDELKFVYAMIVLLLEYKKDLIIPAPNCKVEARNIRPLRSELPAVWSDTSNAMRGLKDHSLHMLVLEEVLELELSNFSRLLKMKPGIDDDQHVILEMSNDLRFKGMEFYEEEKPKRQNAKETKAYLEAIVLRTKTGSKQVSALESSNSSIRHQHF